MEGLIMPDKEEKNNVVPFERPKVSVALDGFTPDGRGPWLFQMPEGAMVAVCSKIDSKDFNCGVFTVISKTDKTVRIVNPKQGIDALVVPNRFCNQYDFVEIRGMIDLSSILNGESLLNEDSSEEKGS